MRICIIGSSTKFYSGISAYTTVMSNALSEHGHQVSVILLRNLVPKFLYPGRNRVGRENTTTNYRNDINVYEGMDWNSPRSWMHASHFMQCRAPELVIMHWWTSSVAHMQLFLAASARKMCGKPLLLLEMHEVVDPLEESILPIRMYSWIAGRCLVSACNGYVVHSRETREAVARAYGIDAAKIFVVPHGPYDNYSINATDTAKKDLNLGDGFTILNFGMLRRYKGISILVDAFGLLPAVIARKSWLVIAGEDWGDDPEIRPAIERSPFRDRIVFRAEFVPDEEVGVYFSAADVVVLPYQRTCGSGVANIALAQRKPIITTDLATMRECLDGYHGAEYFLVNDTTGLRNQILKAFERWERGENTLTPAAKTAATWERIVAGYERIVDDLRREK